MAKAKSPATTHSRLAGSRVNLHNISKEAEAASEGEQDELAAAQRVKAATASFFFDLDDMLRATVSTLQSKVFAAMQAQGFWEGQRDNFGSKIALLHSELSELLEANREGNAPSKKIPGYTGEEEEAADLLIRLLDMAGRYGWDLGGAVAAKMQHNMTRPRKHGKAY